MLAVPVETRLVGRGSRLVEVIEEGTTVAAPGVGGVDDEPADLDRVGIGQLVGDSRDQPRVDVPAEPVLLGRHQRFEVLVQWRNAVEADQLGFDRIGQALHVENPLSRRRIGQVECSDHGVTLARRRVDVACFLRCGARRVACKLAGPRLHRREDAE